jgi:hypothetical protein
MEHHARNLIGILINKQHINLTQIGMIKAKQCYRKSFESSFATALLKSNNLTVQLSRPDGRMASFKWPYKVWPCCRHLPFLHQEMIWPRYDQHQGSTIGNINWLA